MAMLTSNDDRTRFVLAASRSSLLSFDSFCKSLVKHENSATASAVFVTGADMCGLVGQKFIQSA